MGLRVIGDYFVRYFKLEGYGGLSDLAQLYHIPGSFHSSACKREDGDAKQLLNSLKMNQIREQHLYSLHKVKRIRCKANVY